VSGSLEELKALIPPPSAVAAPPWGEALNEVGFEFPADYRAFVDTYGGGTFERPEYVGLIVDAPHCHALGPGGRLGFGGFVGIQLDQVRPLFTYPGAEEGMWNGEPRPLYPEPGGLLSWGSTEESDQFFWLTQDTNPDRWPVVGWSRHDGSTFDFDGGMVEFLLALFTGRVDHFGEWDMPGLSWEMGHDWLHRN
jgi:hypothetical protein